MTGEQSTAAPRVPSGDAADKYADQLRDPSIWYDYERGYHDAEQADAPLRAAAQKVVDSCARAYLTPGGINELRAALAGTPPATSETR